MTEKKRFFMNSPFKFFLSLFMAVILFACSSMTADAAIHADGDFTYNFYVQNTYVFLDFFGNYTEDGSDRTSSIPYTYSGSNTFYFNLRSTSNTGSSYRYATGYLTKRVMFSLVSQVPDATFNVRPQISVISSSLPEGMNVSVTYVGGSATEFFVDVFLYLDNVDTFHAKRGSFSYNLETSLYASAEYYGAAYSTIRYSVTAASDYSGYCLLSDNVYDIGGLPGLLNDRLNSIYSRLGDINTNISNQGNYIVNKIQNHITNDNSLAQNQIKNDNALAQNQITNDNSIAKNQITNDNNLSKNEIDSAYNNSVREINTANKNADDIMHSYDSGLQESDNKRFDDSQKQLQETEDNLFGSASDYFSGLDMSLFDIAKFTSVVSSLSFVSGLMQSLYTKMGDFGLIVTVGMVIMIASKVIGVYRFSTGDHGKGG